LTTQVSETLLHEGQELQLRCEPLAQFAELGGSLPAFQASMTALWRGYIGTWEITQDRLYLIGVSGTLATGGHACLEDIFPGFPERVFAHWYSGTLLIPIGQRLKSHYERFRPVYEQDLLLEIDRGQLSDKRVRDNRARMAELEQISIARQRANV